MYHTLTWLKDNEVVNKKSNVNFDGLYEELLNVYSSTSKIMNRFVYGLKGRNKYVT